MAKESADAPPKKRRVTKTNNTETTPLAINTEKDLYTEIVNYENQLAKDRMPEKDAQLFTEICSQLKEIFAEILALKLTGEDNKEAIKEKRIQATMKIITLKKMNRLQKLRTKENRIALQKAREQVDMDHLHLQNLLYEVVHLTKEVKKCLEFKSKDEDMDLVPVEEFYEKAPASVSNPKITQNDDHKLRLARLQWELSQRKELAIQCRKMEGSKETVAKDIEQKKGQLNSLGPCLKTILDSTKPLQDHLGTPIDKTKKLNEKALLLPKSLYVLFVQADALSRCVDWLSISITGDCDKAITEDTHLDDISSDDSDSDNDAEQTHRRKLNFQDRRKSGGTNAPDKEEQKKKDCLKKHPLSVVVKVSGVGAEVLTLELQWLMTLEMVCVLTTVSGAHKEGSGIAAEDLFSPKNLLASLFPGDRGAELPNSSSFYHLQKAGMDTFPTNIAGLGVPFKWAQKLCGIDITTATLDAKVEVCRSGLEGILQAIRTRFQGRLALAVELQQLEKGMCVAHRKLSTVLNSMVPITADVVERQPGGRTLFDDGTMDQSFLFYKANAQNGPVKVYAYVAVSPNYPDLAPIILLEVIHKGTFTAANCEAVRDVEREVNLYEAEAGTSVAPETAMLSRQIQKLLFCIEVLAVTEFDVQSQGCSMFFRRSYGRARNHPYRFIQSAGGIFTHR